MARAFAGNIPPKNRLQIAGLKEAERLFNYMSGRKKNILVRRSYGYATKEYRAALRRATPVGKEMKNMTIKGKPAKRLNQTIGYARSKKYANMGKLVEPFQVGHLNKKGSFHNHLVIRGRAAIEADGSALQRGKGKRKDLMQFHVGGKAVFAKKVKATKPNPYVGQIAAQYKERIASSFGDAFVRSLDIEAKKILKQYYVA